MRTRETNRLHRRPIPRSVIFVSGVVVAWIVSWTALESRARAQDVDPIDQGGFAFRRDQTCGTVQRISGVVFSGPRGYLVEKRSVEARAEGANIFVEEHFLLRNRGKSCLSAHCEGKPCGHVQVRLPLPMHAGIGGACMAEGGECRPLAVRRDTDEPHVLVVDVDMLAPDEQREISARYVVSAVPLFDTRSWLSATLPPRGLDERAASKIEVKIVENEKTAARIETRDAGLSLDLQVPVIRKRAPLLVPGQRSVIVLDQSPSMDGPAQGRVAQVLTGLLDLAAPDMRVRFGYLRGGLVVDPAWQPVASLGSLASLLHVQDPPLSWLRSRTDVGSLAELFRQDVGRGDRVLLVTDGALHLDTRARTFFRRARKEGVRVELINLDAHVVEGALARLVQQTGGVVRELGARWEVVPRHLLDGYVRGALGETTLKPTRLHRFVGWKRKALAERRSQHRPRVPVQGKGVPAESALRMLREQLVPAARLCLRRDRRGRQAHERRATFLFELTRQEVEGLEVLGKLPESLRSCLRDAAASLSVPRFDGRVRVRYPIYTEKADAPPTIELRPETRSLLDDLMGPPVSTSLPSL